MGSSSKKKNAKKSNHIMQHGNNLKNEYPSYFNKDGWMELNIRSTNKKSLHSTIKHEEHAITMHPSDARLLHLSNRSQVLILKYRDNMKNLCISKSETNDKQIGYHQDNSWIPFAAICYVNVIDTKTSKNKIKEGNALISPKILEDRLLRTAFQSSSSMSNKSSPIPKSNLLQASPSKPGNKKYTPKIQTPSPSKSTFSFAIGGGGDQMISPVSSSIYTPTNKIKQNDLGSTSKTIQTTNSKMTILLFPFKHKSSSFIANLITNHLTYFSASSITLQLLSHNSNTNNTSTNTNTTNTKNSNNNGYNHLLDVNDQLHSYRSKSDKSNHSLIYKGNEKILEKLATASLHDIFLQKDDLVQIPYQGIKRIFQVISITNSTLERKYEMNLLNKSFTELSLEQRKEFISKKEESNDENSNFKEMMKQDDHFGTVCNLSTAFVSKLVDIIQSGEYEIFDNKGKALFPILFHVGYNTKVLFQSPDETNTEMESDICNANSDSSLDALYRKQKGNGNPFKNIRKYPPNQMKVGGLSHIYEKLEITLENPLFRPWLYQNKSSALRPPKGILLYGPSGVGKVS